MGGYFPQLHIYIELLCILGSRSCIRWYYGHVQCGSIRSMLLMYIVRSYVGQHSPFSRMRVLNQAHRTQMKQQFCNSPQTRNIVYTFNSCLLRKMDDVNCADVEKYLLLYYESRKKCQWISWNFSNNDYWSVPFTHNVLCARHQMSNSLMRKTCYFRTNSIHINITHLRKYHVWRKPSRAPLSVSWYSSAIDISGPFVVWQNVLCLACPQYNRLLHKYNYARRYTHEYTRPAVLHALYAKRGLKDKLTHQIESRECWKISVIESICPHMCHVCVCVCCCCCCLIGRLRFPSPKFSLSWHVMHVWVSAYACMCSLCYIMMRVSSRSPPAGIADADHRHCCYCCCWSVWKCFEHIHVQREYIVNMQITWITTVRIEHVACSVQFYFYLIAFSYHSIYYIYYIEMLLSIFLFFVCFILWILLRLVKEATHALCCPAIISDWVPVINLKNKNNMTTTIWL